MQLVLYNRAKKVRKWLTFDKLGISLPTEASCCTVIEDYFIPVHVDKELTSMSANMQTTKQKASLQAAGRLALAEEAIVVDNFSKSYGSRRVVDQLQFTVHKGEIFALLGPNGAGKTTAVETLEGYRTPDQGSVRVLGLDPIREAQALKPHIGVMLQQDGLYPGLTAREVLRLFAGYYRQPQSIDELLERLGLTAAARTRCRRLSGGQKRRLALALATPAQLTGVHNANIVRFVAPPDLDCSKLAALPSAQKAEEIRPGSYLIETAQVPALLAELTAWLRDNNITLSELRVGHGSLEDLFLRLTGAEVRE